MKKYLLKIKEDLKADLYTSSMMISSLTDTHKINIAKILLANAYLLSQEVENVIHCLDLIREDCHAEIKDSFFQDRVLLFYDDEETVYDPAKHNPFTNILEMFNENDLKLSEDLIGYIQSQSQKKLSMRKLFLDHFTNVLITRDGFDVSHNEMLQDSLKRDYETQVNILEGFEMVLNELHELAERKGSIARILNLIE
jgi:hypothetical protein